MSLRSFLGFGQSAAEKRAQTSIRAVGENLSRTQIAVAAEKDRLVQERQRRETSTVVKPFLDKALARQA